MISISSLRTDFEVKLGPDSIRSYPEGDDGDECTNAGREPPGPPRPSLGRGWAKRYRRPGAIAAMRWLVPSRSQANVGANASTALYLSKVNRTCLSIIICILFSIKDCPKLERGPVFL